jgi:hypothetical protein
MNRAAAREQLIHLGYAELLDVLIERNRGLTEQTARVDICVDQLPDRRHICGTRSPDGDGV